MTHEEFNLVLESRLKKTTGLLAAKSKEYATDGDKLYNFKRAANMLKCSPKKALWGMASKHLISVIDIVESDGPVNYNLFDEKIGDLINYLILLEAILHEEAGIGHVTCPESNIIIEHMPETLRDIKNKKDKIVANALECAIRNGYDKRQIEREIYKVLVMRC